jgi:hypothetical protein
MRFCSPRLVAPLESGKDAILLLQRLGSCALDRQHFVLANVLLGRDRVKVKILAQHNDAGSLGVVAHAHWLQRDDIAVLRCAR